MAKDTRSIAQKLRDRGRDLRKEEERQVGGGKKAPAPPKKKPSR